MIDTQSETLIQFCKLPVHLEKILGRRLALSTLHRWRMRGADGVKLETVLLGGCRYSSAEALNRFFAKKTAVADGEKTVVIPARDKAKKAQRYLESQGFGPSKRNN